MPNAPAVPVVYDCMSCGRSIVIEQSLIQALMGQPTVGCYDCGEEMALVRYGDSVTAKE